MFFLIVWIFLIIYFCLGIVGIGIWFLLGTFFTTFFVWVRICYIFRILRCSLIIVFLIEVCVVVRRIWVRYLFFLSFGFCVCVRSRIVYLFVRYYLCCFLLMVLINWSTRIILGFFTLVCVIFGRIWCWRCCFFFGCCSFFVPIFLIRYLHFLIRRVWRIFSSGCCLCTWVFFCDLCVFILVCFICRGTFLRV